MDLNFEINDVSKIMRPLELLEGGLDKNPQKRAKYPQKGIWHRLGDVNVEDYDVGVMLVGST